MKVIQRLLRIIIGEDILYDAYFSNDSKKVLKAMIEAEEE